LIVNVEYQWFVGIDWATTKNDGCLIDTRGRRVLEFEFPNTPEGLHQLCSILSERAGGDLASIATAIEIPHGAIVECLVKRGFHVFSINPKQLDRFRDRHCPSGSKNDQLDAFVLADSLRTDIHCFRRIKIPTADIVFLRELTRMDGDLAETRNRVTNRLRSKHISTLSWSATIVTVLIKVITARDGHRWNSALPETRSQRRHDALRGSFCRQGTVNTTPD
jgi:hypothetical protein